MEPRKLESYRSQVKKRRVRSVVQLAAAVLVEGAAGMYSFFILGREHANSHLHGFVMGIGFGLLLCVIAFVARDIILCSKALISEETLSKMYIAETDERTRLINDKVGGMGYNLAMGGIAVAGAAASLIDPVVSVTLYAALAFMVLVRAVLIGCYNKAL